MFTHQLAIFQKRSKQSKIGKLSTQNHIQNEDLHFQICSVFLKNINQKLLFKEVEIISDSSSLLHKISSNFTYSQKDIFGQSTNNSVFSPQSFLSDDFQTRMILRRNNNRRSLKVIQDSIQQVKQECSFLTFEVLSNLATQFAKTQSKLAFIETKKNIICKKQEAADKYHEQNLMTKKQLQVQRIKVKKLEQDSTFWKEKYEKLSQTFQQKLNNINKDRKLFHINQKVYQQVRSFLQDKQTLINSRLQRIHRLQDSILQKMSQIFYEQNQTVDQLKSSVQDDLNQKSCIKCCQLMRKLKNSILDFRDYIVNEAEQVDILFQKHKDTIFTPFYQNITSNKSIT